MVGPADFGWEMVNCDTLQPVVPLGFSDSPLVFFILDQNNEESIQLEENVLLANVNTLVFKAEKVLNFNKNRLVTGINIVDDMLFWTDNFSEPKKINITRVYYKTPAAMWRFFGYYGGINVIGNMMTYGQFADDSTFEIIPAWQNKMQAMAYEDHIYTRISHYSYELINNKLTLFPPPDGRLTDRFFVRFTIERDAWEDDADGNRDTGVGGINNLNTLPFDNLPYKNINAIGKHWIRRYALSLCKEMLGQIRGKFGGAIPIPGDNVTLNYGDLLSQAATEQAALITELKTILNETTYLQLMKNDAELLDATGKILEETPSPIFVG